MTIGLLTNIVSPHQLPLAKAIVARIGVENYRYVYTEDFHPERAKMGWSDAVEGLRVEKLNDANRKWLESADLVYCEERDFDLFESRLRNHRSTCYVSERWFKPIQIELKFPLLTYFLDLLSLTPSHLHLLLPGWLRLLVPSYFRMAWRFVKVLSNPHFRYLPQGKWAGRDMRLLCRLYSIFRLHLSPPPTFTPWGYFVAPSTVDANFCSRSQQGQSSTVHLRLTPSPSPTPLRVLWVGRMISWKRVDTIIRAVAFANRPVDANFCSRPHQDQSSAVDLDLRSRPSLHLHLSPSPSFTLTIVGDGPEKPRLQKLSSTVHLHLSPSPFISFLPSVPISEIRPLMRAHDVYVLASTGEEGWGAALNEAMEEGMFALGTFEAGSSSYMLPDSHKFHAGDWRRLAELLRQVAEGKLQRIPIGDWTAAKAASRMIDLAECHQNENIRSSTSTQNFD